MNLLKFAAPISILLMSLSAFAANETNVNVIEKTVIRNSSEHNRMKIDNSVMVQLVGAGPTGGSGSGILFSHYFDSDSAIQIEALGSRSNWEATSTWGSRTEMNGTTFGVFYKKFNGNSFYFKGGVDYSTFEYKHDYISSISSAYNDGYSFKGNKVSGSIAIGNQWQWENFTMGCDWIGWSTPVSNTVSEEKSYGDDMFTERDLRQAKDTYLKNGYPIALHFYLGASF